MHNIILCGFMGCGKTTVGRLLSRQLEMEYIDLDSEIEAEEGLSISDLFSRFGELYFRDLEHQAIKALTRRINCVVSVGGGAMTFPRNVAALDQGDTLIFLDASFDRCYERIKRSDRPIVRGSSPDRLHALFDDRYPLYLSAATLRIDADLPAAKVADKIIAHFKK